MVTRYKQGRGFLVDAILKILKENGPMTRAELCKHLQQHDQHISSVVARMRRGSKTIPKRLHISNYVYDDEGARRYPRAVYALGNYPCAKSPGPQKKLNKKRYDEARRAKFAMNSVFNLGLPRRLYGKGSPNEDQRA